uniref:Docking protein 3 n=1 Tax=Cebus imitator TaxID=2715852 RepID=A0A2K5RSA1_CEBIM
MEPLETPVKDGILYQQHVKFGKKCWRKVWALLYAGGPSGVARLESWEVRDGGLGAAGDRSAGPGRRGERRVIRLADCVSVLPADGESCPRDTGAFLLTTTERSHLLAAQHRQAWMGPICQLAFPSTGEASSGSTDVLSPKRGLVPMEENSIYSSWQEVGKFSVVVQRTEAAARCQLKGPALLVLGPDAIQLREAKGAQALYSWPYHFLRKFGCDKILLGTPGLSLLIFLLRAYSVPGTGGHGRVQDSFSPVLQEPTFQPRSQAPCLQGSAAHTLGTS